jgi:hypothetical protein
LHLHFLPFPINLKNPESILENSLSIFYISLLLKYTPLSPNTNSTSYSILPYSHYSIIYFSHNPKRIILKN